jgi:hypothetical protein
MPAYFRGSDLEPSVEDLKQVLDLSAPSDWIYDDESRIFTHRENLLIFLAPSEDGNYNLRYGHMEIFSVQSEQIGAYFSGSSRTVVRQPIDVQINSTQSLNL